LGFHPGLELGVSGGKVPGAFHARGRTATARSERGSPLMAFDQAARDLEAEDNNEKAG